MVRSLNPCLFKRSWVRNHPQTCHIKCEEKLFLLSVIPGKRNHEMWSHREGGPTLHCSISLPIQLAFSALHINQYLTKIVEVFAYQLSMHCFDHSTYSVEPFCFAYKRLPYEYSKHICINYQCTASISLPI